MDVLWLLFSFKGRSTRTQFWIFSICMFAIMLLPAFFVYEPFSDESDVYIDVMAIIFLWPMFAVQAKRWHDRNKSGWWVLIHFIPVIGSLWTLIENGFLEGTDGSNRFGESPNQKHGVRSLYTPFKK
jgi:uncharacterized membrane protein YhaH (DUF805 family)